MLINDLDIKATARHNRPHAVEMTVQKYRDRLYYHALGIVKDAQEAYDAVQEVFIKAIRERRFFNPDFQMRAWLFRVTSNLCYNIVRDKKRRRGILETIPQKLPREDRSGTHSLEKVFSGEMRQEIFSAMEHISPNHREILILRYYYDLSYSEIAASLQIKLGTVMSRLSRARNRLSDVFGPDHPAVAEAI